MKRLLLACLLLTLALPAAAGAQEVIATDNFRHIANFPYELRYESANSAGTDIEFATLTVGAELPAVIAPATPTLPSAKKKRKPTKYAACVKKARKIKSKSKRRKATRKCQRYKKKAKKKAKKSQALVDIDASRPGVQRTYAFAGSYNNGLQIFDISDQDAIKHVATYDCGISQGDVQVFTRPDLGNRTFVTYAADDGYSFVSDSKCATEADALGYDASGKGGQGTYIAEVTDPKNPKTVSYVHFAKGSHNQTVHPNGKYLYNSNSDLATDIDPGIEVVDITDLSKPVESAVLKITPLPGLGSDSHDIWFNEDGTRAYSAAVSQGIVIDTTDPAKPSIISTIFDPAVNVFHQLEAIEADVPGLGKRSVIIAGDEFAGATGTGQCPNGAIHMYDATGPLEANPVKLGVFNIGEVRPTDSGGPVDGTCTSHVFQINREQNLMAVAWYDAGTRMIDTTEAMGVAFGANGTGFKELGTARVVGGSVWAVKSPFMSRTRAFNVFANDHIRGLDVWRFDPNPGKRARGGAAIKFTPASEQAPARRLTSGFVCRLD